MDNLPGMPDIANRNAKDSRHGGDIEGILQHLDYIAGMGFTSIWINPVLENNMPKYSYHGYAITDFYKVDARMGTNESYKKLCVEAHKKGIKVIQDQVLNHCVLSHWWMSDPPTRDWINYYQQDLCETNHRKTLQPDPYAAKEDMTILENGWFVKSMPDLNVTNSYLAQYLIQNSIWWIEFRVLMEFEWIRFCIRRKILWQPGQSQSCPSIRILILQVKFGMNKPRSLHIGKREK
jgi:glycosidase